MGSGDMVIPLCLGALLPFDSHVVNLEALYLKRAPKTHRRGSGRMVVLSEMSRATPVLRDKSVIAGRCARFVEGPIGERPSERQWLEFRALELNVMGAMH